MSIKIDFGNIISEMEKKSVKLFLVRGVIGWFLTDKDNKIYQIEDYYHGGYLDRYIKNKNIISFHELNEEKSNYCKSKEMEIFDICKIKKFITNHI